MAASSGRSGPPARDLRCAPGPLAVEDALLGDLERERARLRVEGPPQATLARPLRVIVPGHSLALHLAARVLGRGAIAGVEIETLHAFAAGVLVRAGERRPRGACLFAAVVRRHARLEPALERELGHLDGGWRAVVATLAELFDAGFESSLADDVQAALAGAGASQAAGANEAAVASVHVGARAFERARALLRVAAASARDLEREGLGRSPAIYRQAARAIAREPALAAARAVWIHGFSDATAAACDLLQALAREARARIYFDTLLGAQAPTGIDGRYGRHFRERLGLDGADAHPSPGVPESIPPGIEAFRARGRQEEAREVARRVAGLVDGGARPERIGVVARDLEPWRLALRHPFRRLGVPYSALATPGVPGPAERRAQSFAELLQAGLELSVERWLDARAPRVEDSPPPETGAGADRAARPIRPLRDFDLLLALRALGALRLADVLAIDLDLVLGGRAAFPLPVQSGSAPREAVEAGDAAATGDDEPRADDDAEGAGSAEGHATRGAKLRRRYVARRELELARREISALGRFLGAAPERATAARHAARARTIARRHLRWRDDTPGHAALEAALAFLESDLPERVPLSGEEFTLLFERALADHGRASFGGLGGGVACLSVAEARARTFEHLFVLGLEHGVFPRSVREDPLLCDELRRRIARVLPDLALRAQGFEEERFLFEQLVRASPRVTLSWASEDDDGRALAPSPFVERLFPGGSAGSTGLALAPARTSEPGPLTARPAHEHAVLAGLGASRADFERVLAIALRPAAKAGLLAAARTRILDEIDPPPALRARLGPYFGFVGGQMPEGDLRGEDVWVTTLEKLADCGWRTFLSQLLRVEAVPDALGSLPSVDARMVGNLVHAVLERLARQEQENPGEPRARSLEEVRDGAGLPPLRRPAAELEALLAGVAREVLRDEGIVLSGLARVLVEQARPLLEVALRVDEQERAGGALLLGVEIEGAIALGAGASASPLPRRLRFVADRVERVASGALRLSDYKTGRALVAPKLAATRARHLLQRVERGRGLQSVAYARAGGAGALGRYLFLAPELADAARTNEVAHEDAPARAAFDRATATLLDAWREGVFLPRLVDASGAREHAGCAWCEVREACSRGDSGARVRLVGWVRDREAEPEGLDGGLENAAWRWWQLAGAGTPS